MNCVPLSTVNFSRRTRTAFQLMCPQTLLYSQESKYVVSSHWEYLLNGNKEIHGLSNHFLLVYNNTNRSAGLDLFNTIHIIM